MENRIVIITGATGGLGTGVTRKWIEAGASVVAVGHSESGIEQLSRSIGASDRLAPLAVDVTTPEGAARMVAFAEERFAASADTLLHLVGGFTMGPLDGPESAAQWEQMRKMNLDSAFYCYAAILPGLKKQGRGWIVGIGSRAAVQPGAQLTAYAAAKAGLTALTQALSAEVRDANIHVNLILTSIIDTPANRQAMGEKQAAKWVTPEQIADATLFLCSEQSTGIHGATLEIYGKT